MNNTFSIKKMSETGYLDSNVILRQYKLHLMARLMEIQCLNPRLGQDQIIKEIGCSSKTLQRYKSDIKMLSPNRIPANSNKRKQKISIREQDFERSRLTSIDLERSLTSKDDDKTVFKKVKTNKNSKSGDPNDIHNRGRDFIEQAFSSQ